MLTILFLVVAAGIGVYFYRRATATSKQPEQPVQSDQPTQNTPSEITGVSGASS